MPTIASRGKFAESAVKRHLASINSQTLAWHRFADARAGSFAPTLADFLVISNGQPILLEVKEVAHHYRLPVSNFKLENRARMRLFELAGCRAMILVYHSTSKIWRHQPLEFFGIQSTGSWDLRNTPELTLKEAITQCLQ